MGPGPAVGYILIFILPLFASLFRLFAARLAYATHGDGEPFFLFVFRRPCDGRFATRCRPGLDDLR